MFKTLRINRGRFDRIDVIAAAPFGTIAVAALLAGTLPEKQQAKTADKSKTVTGTQTTMGNGHIASWVRVDADGKPTAVGVNFDEASLLGLPISCGPSSTPTCCTGPEFAMELPRNIAGLPFTHVAVNWNPKGHEPEGVYDKPHFDFHFYTIPSDLRTRITAEGKDLEIAAKPLPAEQIPPSYTQVPGAFPKLGAYWVDPTGAEFSGKGFTKTLIYGSYDGKISFIEPMITMAYLQTKPDSVETIKLPQKYPAVGFYPKSYRVSFDHAAGQYTVALEDLVQN